MVAPAKDFFTAVVNGVIEIIGRSGDECQTEKGITSRTVLRRPGGLGEGMNKFNKSCS
jgi:hypothetical protein